MCCLKSFLAWVISPSLSYEFTSLLVSPGSNFSITNSLADEFSELGLPSRKPYVRQNIFLCKSLHITLMIFLIYLLRFKMTVSKSVNIFMALTFVLIFILLRLWECQYSSTFCSDLLPNGLYNFSLFLTSIENFLFFFFFIGHFHGILKKSR